MTDSPIHSLIKCPLWQQDWNRFAREALGVRLDRKQRLILRDIQYNRRVSVRSGHARGKDYVAAVAAACFLYLNYPATVVQTAPTDRQVVKVMMTEIRKLVKNAKVNLGGFLMSHGIILDEDDWFLIGFTANEKQEANWGGFHNENVMVVITEASGMAEDVFESIEGLLTGANTKQVLIFNPLRTVGFAYNSMADKRFVQHKLNCLNAPNVRAGSMKFIKKKNLIPGQVDYAWVKDKVENWCKEIEPDEYGDHSFDFKFEGKLYRGSDIFAKRVMGEFPQSSEDVLIPAAWVDAAFDRYRKQGGESLFTLAGDLRLGADIAGLGIDSTTLCPRRGDIFNKIDQWFQQDLMVTAGKIKHRLRNGGTGYIDSIGEGSGVYSRCKEQGVSVISVKGSYAADKKDVNGKVLRKLTDYTKQLTFTNMKSYMFWALRDALNPANKRNVMIYPDDELKEEMANTTFCYRSNGDIIVDPNDELKKAIGRSPDKLRGLLCTFFPHFKSVRVHQQARSKVNAGFY